MKDRYFVFKIILTTAFLLVSIFTVNYIIDPIKSGTNFETRPQKYKDLKEIRPTTIILGGSRTQFLDTDSVKYYTHDKVYNISMKKMSLYEQLHFIKFSIREFDIKNVIIGLNFYTFAENAINHERTFDQYLLERNFSFKYLMSLIRTYLSFDTSLKTIDRFISSDYLNKKLYTKSGSRTLYSQKKLLKNKDWNRRIKRINEYYAPLAYTQFKLSEQKLNYYQQIVNLCKKNNITLKVFTTSVHESLYDIATNLATVKELKKWKYKIAQISPYYDFMYLNSVSRNNDNYIDPSHLKLGKTNLYMKMLFNDHGKNYPIDFGRFVSKDNIGSHIESIHQGE